MASIGNTCQRCTEPRVKLATREACAFATAPFSRESLPLAAVARPGDWSTRMVNPTVVVVDYDEEWPRRFEKLRARIWPVVPDVAIRIEHVGSTSVPGLAAKPIIDMTVVVGGRDVPLTIKRLATLGTVIAAISVSRIARPSMVVPICRDTICMCARKGRSVLSINLPSATISVRSLTPRATTAT